MQKRLSRIFGGVSILKFCRTTVGYETASTETLHACAVRDIFTLCSSLYPNFCGCCTAGGDRTTATSSRPTQQPNTHRRTSYQVHDAYSNKTSSSTYHWIAHVRPCRLAMPQDIKSSSCTYHWNAYVHPFQFAMPQGCQVNPIPKGNLVYLTIILNPLRPNHTKTGKKYGHVVFSPIASCLHY